MIEATYESKLNKALGLLWCGKNAKRRYKSRAKGMTGEERDGIDINRRLTNNGNNDFAVSQLRRAN